MNPQYAEVALRAGHRCEYCHAPEVVFNLPLEVEHIIPISRGGAESGDNLARSHAALAIFTKLRTSTGRIL